MPYKSEAQRRLMQAAAHNPEFARKVGVPSEVAQEFERKSKGREGVREALLAKRKPSK